MRNSVWLLGFSTMVGGLSASAFVVGCGSGAGAGNGVGASGSGGAASSAAGATGQAGQPQASGGASGGATQTYGGATSSAGATQTDGGTTGTGAAGSGSAGTGAAGSGSAGSGTAGSGAAGSGATLQAGNPDGSCSAGVPTLGKPADVSSPTTIVGTGTAASCTFSLLDAAVMQGGVITFNCGSDPVAIAITATMNLPTTKNTVIDGGGKITLDGKSAVQILRFDSANFRATDFGLTLQHITLTNGKTTPTEVIPTAPAPCSQGFDDGEGGALYVRDGALTIIDSVFTNNQAAPLGPDTGGGAVYILGSKRGALIVGSTFTGNTASNGGGVAAEFAELDIYNSLFTNDKATGHDANDNEPAKCSAMNNGQNETGSGGNGGPIYSDGNSLNITLCGDKITGNAAGMNAFGGGLFFTSNDFGGTLSIADTTMTGNTGGSWTSVKSGSVTNVGTAVGTNCQSITVTNSTLQGYP
jgi:hypothetical protein